MRKLIFCSLGLLSLFILAGCNSTKKAPLKMTTTVKPTIPIENGDYYAKRRNSGEDIPLRRGSEFVEVRTYQNVKTEKNGRTTTKKEEITDVNCLLESEMFRASFITPAQVEVPDYGYASSALRISCQLDGYHKAFKNVKAYDIEKQARMNNAASAGVLGIIAGGIINAADDEKNNDFAYPAVDVILQKIE